MNRLLPVGTVVKLDIKSEIKYMIFARMVKKEEGDKNLYDYCGCRVPQGAAKQENLVFFKHGDIKQLLFIGYQDEEELQYSGTLAEIRNSSEMVENRGEQDGEK